MKIRKAIKLATVGAIAATPALVSAGSPLPSATFGNWSVDASGAINASDPTGMTCASTDNSTTGFLQHQCVNSSGTTFIRTIVGEGETNDAFDSFNSDGGKADFFGDESFVTMGGGDGLSGRQQLVHGHDAVLEANARLNTGSDFMPMTSATDPATLASTTDMVELDQSITDTGEEFTTSFGFDHGMLNADSAGMADGKYALLSLGQNANDSAEGFNSGFDLEELEWEDLNEAGHGVVTGFTGTATNATTYDAGRTLTVNSDLAAEGITQSFDLGERDGVYVTASGTATFDDNTTATWAAGEEIEALLVGQHVEGAGDFSLNDFANLSETTQAGDLDSFLTDGALVTFTNDPFQF